MLVQDRFFSECKQTRVVEKLVRRILFKNCVTGFSNFTELIVEQKTTQKNPLLGKLL